MILKLKLLLLHLLRIEKAHNRMVKTKRLIEERDRIHTKMIEAGRMEDKVKTPYYEAQLEILKWILQE